MPDLNKKSGEELVPLDDTGPEVDIEIDEDSSLPITTQQPEKPLLEEGLTQVIDPEVVVGDDNEHEEYSKGVKKRIDKLTGKLREAERREKAATAYAKNVYTENQSLQEQKTNLDGNYIIAEANRITAETEATKNILRKASKNNEHCRNTRQPSCCSI